MTPNAAALYHGVWLSQRGTVEGGACNLLRSRASGLSLRRRRRSKAHGDALRAVGSRTPPEPPPPLLSPRRGRRNRWAAGQRSVRRSAAPFGGWGRGKEMTGGRARVPTALKASPWALFRRPIRGWAYLCMIGVSKGSAQLVLQNVGDYTHPVGGVRRATVGKAEAAAGLHPLRMTTRQLSPSWVRETTWWPSRVALAGTFWAPSWPRTSVSTWPDSIPSRASFALT